VLRAAGGPATAEKWVRDALARKERLMGFGHRRLQGRRRAGAGVERVRPEKRRRRRGQRQWEETAAVIEGVMASEKNMHPNLDWPAGRLFHALGLEVPLYTPIFVAARVAGWAAHVIEQQQHNRLIRPRSRYVGPEPRPVTALAER